MTGEAGKRLETAGANQRVAEMRQKLRTSSKPAEREDRRATATAKSAFAEEKPARGKGRGKDKPSLTEREKWLAERGNQPNQRRRQSGGDGFRLDRGPGYFLLIAAFIGGGGAFGVLAADMGSIELAARHLAAAPHCETAKLAGMAPAVRGEAGYWAHNDPANEGVSCR